MSEKNDPKSIFVWAERAFRAAAFLQQGSSGDHRLFPMLAVPSTILYAFSLELYFKCLITIHSGNTPRDHDLERLFGRISHEHQKRIRDAFKDVMPPFSPEHLEHLRRNVPGALNLFDFDGMLADNKNSFEKLRYIYEPSSQGVACFSAGPILAATRKVMNELHPEWLQSV